MFNAEQVSCIVDVETGAPRHRPWPGELRQCVRFPVVAKSKIIALSVFYTKLILPKPVYTLTSWQFNKATASAATESITFKNGLIAASIILNTKSVCQISRFKFRAACVIGFRTYDSFWWFTTYISSLLMVYDLTCRSIKEVVWEVLTFVLICVVKWKKLIKMDEDAMWKSFYDKLQQQKSIEEQEHDKK